MKEREEGEEGGKGEGGSEEGERKKERREWEGEITGMRDREEYIRREKIEN